MDINNQPVLPPYEVVWIKREPAEGATWKPGFYGVREWSAYADKEHRGVVVGAMS